MKITPLIKAIKIANSEDKNINYRFVYTGQDYDKKMSGDFFEQLGIPLPDVNLESGSGSQAEQTATIMVRFGKELLENTRWNNGRITGFAYSLFNIKKFN